MMGHAGRGVDGVVDGLVVAALELADGDDHVQLARAQTGQRGGLLAQRGDQRSAERKADDRRRRESRRRRAWLTAVETQTGLTMAQANR